MLLQPLLRLVPSGASPNVRTVCGAGVQRLPADGELRADDCLCACLCTLHGVPASDGVRSVRRRRPSDAAGSDLCSPAGDGAVYDLSAGCFANELPGSRLPGLHWRCVLLILLCRHGLPARSRVCGDGCCGSSPRSSCWRSRLPDVRRRCRNNVRCVRRHVCRSCSTVCTRTGHATSRRADDVGPSPSNWQSCTRDDI